MQWTIRYPWTVLPFQMPNGSGGQVWKNRELAEAWAKFIKGRAVPVPWCGEF
jgi:hypothetical protein